MAKFTGFVKLPENNLTAVMGALATVGPLAVVVVAFVLEFLRRWDREAEQLGDGGLGPRRAAGGLRHARRHGKSCPLRTLPDSAAPPVFPWLYA